MDSEAYDSAMFRPLVNTGIHEFSHSIGMDHESDIYQILGDAKTVVNTNGGSTETVISEDTSEGLVVQYGLRASALEDLSLYHWEWSGSSGAYSTHARTPLKSAAGVPLVPLAGFDEPTYSIAAGTTIRVRQTAENRGRTTQNVTIKWYVSTDDLITTADTVLATSAINIARDVPFTWDRTVTLPNNLTSGADCWVGAIIDTGGVLAENNEINNAIYVAEIEIP
jgi:hypothetical protein